jgi:tyrosinase
MPDNEPNAATPSRQERFRQIMEAAAGTAHPDYQGYGKFWNLPLPDLRRFTLYGIPMMRGGAAPGPAAPPPAQSSCCHEPAAPSPKAPSSGSGAGLPRGLRGQYPFDGTQFPPLPWGGTRVAESDIRFIEQWISEGCPADTEDTVRAAIAATPYNVVQALATGQAAHPACTGPTNQLADDAGRVKARKNIAFLTPDELSRFRAAIAQMKSLDGFYQDERSFGYWARIHANQCQHGWEEFLTWHRAYLYFFEKQLQDIDPTVTLPYWDWAADAVNVKASIDDMGAAVALDNGYVPPAYQCWIDEDGIRALAAGGDVPKPVLDGLEGTLGKTYSSGARLFKDAGIKFGDDSASDNAIIAALERINPLFDWRRWPGGNKDLIFEAYPTPDDVERILNLNNFFAFASGPMDNQFFGALENIHNLIHNFSGGANPYFGIGPSTPANQFPTGDMVDSGRTAFDPIFWGHHANCDRLWHEWQRRHPSIGPDNPDAILPPWNLTVDDTSSIKALGYEYIMAAHVYPTLNTVALQRFRSADTPVHPDVLANHSRAEIRLHALQYVARPGFYIRAFLNTPDAGIQTPTRGNPNYVGQVNMFTGLCIGGPGHCDVPDGPADKFDLRPRAHKTPSSFRIDATEAVSKLSAAGATEFQVNLVALDLDGSLADDALKLDAVSLKFFD